MSAAALVNRTSHIHLGAAARSLCFRKRTGQGGYTAPSCSKTQAMRTQHIEYECAGKALSGYFAVEDAGDANVRKAAILVAHTAIGPQERFVTDVVHRLAEQGYAAFALDLFGAGRCVFGEGKTACIQELRDNRSLIAQRALAAVDVVCGMPGVDATRVAAIGYCLGGKCVLDLMRNAPPDGRLKGVVSFHGILDGGAGASGAVPDVLPRVLAFHGYKDPFVSDEMLVEFCGDMEGRGADYEVRVLGSRVLHAFTRDDKQAPADAEAGLQYSRAAAERSWQATAAFLREVLA